MHVFGWEGGDSDGKGGTRMGRGGLGWLCYWNIHLPDLDEIMRYVTSKLIQIMSIEPLVTPWAICVSTCTTASAAA